MNKKFTAKEDQIIQHFVNIIGSHKWEFIAKFVPGRSAKQCRDRYMNNLKPGLMKVEWDENEDKQLIDLYTKYGPKWSLFCKYLKNRNRTCIKSRFLFLQKHQLNKSHKKNIENEQLLEKMQKNVNYTQNEKEKMNLSTIHDKKNIDNMIQKPTQKFNEKEEDRISEDVITDLGKLNLNDLKSEEFNFFDDFNDDIDSWY